MCRWKTYLSGAGAKPLNHSLRWAVNPSLLISFILKFERGIMSSCTCHCRPCNCKMNNYGCMSFLFDLTMIVLTGGLWLIWIFVREMRNR